MTQELIESIVETECDESTIRFETLTPINIPPVSHTLGEQDKTDNPTMLSFFADAPNCISLAGLGCALGAICLSIRGYFGLAIAGILWAIVFDWLDGIVARKTRGRTDTSKRFGNQIDSIIDMVSFGVFPAIFLMSYGRFSPAFLPGAILQVFVAAIRLSYFTIFGLLDSGHYTGMSLDNNMLVLSFLFVFEGFFPHNSFSFVLYGVLVALLALNVAPVKTPKFGGKTFYALIGYAVALSAFFVRSYLG